MRWGSGRRKLNDCERKQLQKEPWQKQKKKKEWQRGWNKWRNQEEDNKREKENINDKGLRGFRRGDDKGGGLERGIEWCTL